MPHQANDCRYQPGQNTGHYESYFQRANHPTRPLAFWIRYTIFSPRGHPQDAVGEIWAIFFDGENQSHHACKQVFPLSKCRFDSDPFKLDIAGALLSRETMKGACNSNNLSLCWDMYYRGDLEPIYLLPEYLYAWPLPKAKSLVALPLARFNGQLTVADRHIQIDNWLGSQNHNWGSEHTHRYAWGQVAGFDQAPDTFLEIATAHLKIGGVEMPPLTPVVLRHKGITIALNTLRQSFCARATIDAFRWNFSARNREWKISGSIHAASNQFVGLRYANPPGGEKYCLNSKLAACKIRITHKDGSTENLSTEHRAAFELLSDEGDSRVEIVA